MSSPVTTVVLATALFLSSLTAGFLVAFAVVVMPGLKRLEAEAGCR